MFAAVFHFQEELGALSAAGFPPLRRRTSTAVSPERFTERRIGRFVHKFKRLLHITPNAPQRFQRRGAVGPVQYSRARKPSPLPFSKRHHLRQQFPESPIVLKPLRWRTHVPLVPLSAGRRRLSGRIRHRRACHGAARERVILHDRKEEIPAVKFRASTASGKPFLVNGAHFGEWRIGFHWETLGPQFPIHLVVNPPQPPVQRKLDGHFVHIACETETAVFTG